MDIKICDFCGQRINESDLQGFKVKQLKNKTSFDGPCVWHYKGWEAIEMCRDCIMQLYKMRQEAIK